MKKRAERLKNIEKYTFDDLCEIVLLLRDREDGCPWDKEQTHDSLRHNFIEETYEVVEAINKNDTELLCEELGDVLLQVVFHSQLESEENRFSIDDVIDGICKKMVYRHPHIFSNFDGDIVENWEKLKNKEKNRKEKSDVLASVPRELPALLRAQKIYKKSGAENSLLSDSEKELLVSVLERCDAKSSEEKERKAGNFLFGIAALLAEKNINAEMALAASTDAFISENSHSEEERG